MTQFILSLKQRDLYIKKINEQRRWWLVASSIVVSCVICLIFSWELIDEFNIKSIWWAIISMMLIICVNWWYWTMKVIHELLAHQESENKIINELLLEIEDIRKQVHQFGVDTFK